MDYATLRAEHDRLRRQFQTGDLTPAELLASTVVVRARATDLPPAERARLDQELDTLERLVNYAPVPQPSPSPSSAPRTEPGRNEPGPGASGHRESPEPASAEAPEHDVAESASARATEPEASEPASGETPESDASESAETPEPDASESAEAGSVGLVERASEVSRLARRAGGTAAERLARAEAGIAEIRRLADAAGSSSERRAVLRYTEILARLASALRDDDSAPAE